MSEEVLPLFRCKMNNLDCEYYSLRVSFLEKYIYIKKFINQENKSFFLQLYLKFSFQYLSKLSA